MPQQDRRERIAFSAVNRRGWPGYDPGLQRHHLLPHQLVERRGLSPLFDALGHRRTGFDNFRRNGLLLPSRESSAVRLGLPMHRGPHRTYTEMVADRLGQIEAAWSRRRLKEPDRAIDEAFMRLSLLQGALRRRLMDGRNRPLRLNRFDPLGSGRDFSQLDAMADLLWGQTGSLLEAAATNAFPGAVAPRICPAAP